MYNECNTGKTWGLLEPSLRCQCEYRYGMPFHNALACPLKVSNVAFSIVPNLFAYSSMSLYDLSPLIIQRRIMLISFTNWTSCLVTFQERANKATTASVICYVPDGGIVPVSTLQFYLSNALFIGQFQPYCILMRMSRGRKDEQNRERFHTTSRTPNSNLEMRLLEQQQSRQHMVRHMVFVALLYITGLAYNNCINQIQF